MTDIALCMIARDEEELLPACLASVAGVVDEIVLVDTGSSDRTIEIARAAGAKVIPYVWREDFADARNTALRATTCRWILVLDADERLAPGAAEAIRQAVRSDQFDAGFLMLYNALHLHCSVEQVRSSAAARYDEPSALPRLLRRTPDLRWEGCVHENVAGWLTARSQRVRSIPAAIVHYGYTREVGERRGKKQRNLGLLERWCSQEPHNPVPFTYFAWELLTAADPLLKERAAGAAEQGWGALLGLAQTLAPQDIAVHLPSPVPLATVRTLHLLQTDRLAEAGATLDQAQVWSAVHPNLLLLRAVLAERRAVLLEHDAAARAAEFAVAQSAYAQCLAMRERVFTDWIIDGATSWFAATGLGLRMLHAGTPREALVAFDAALAALPTHVPAQLGRAEALIALGRAPDALTMLLPLLEDAAVRRQADAWLLAAAASRELGAESDAQLFVERADAAIAAGGSVQPSRAERLRAPQAGREKKFLSRAKHKRKR